MKKYYLFLLAMLFNCIVGFATPASPNNYIEKVLPDGTTIRLRVCGDEYCNWLETEDGNVVIKTEDGDYRFATVENNKLVSSGINVQEKSRAAYINKEKVYDVIRANRALAIHRQDSLSKLEDTQSSKTSAQSLQTSSNFSFARGNQKVLCILMGFPDKPFTTSASEFEALWNSSSYTAHGNRGSVNQYYKENSCNQLNVTATVVGPYTASQNSDYYKAGYYHGQSVNFYPNERLITEAINAAKNDVSFSNYDLNGDLNVDLVHVVFAGIGLDSGNPNGIVWPHYGQLRVAVELGENLIAKDYICTAEQCGFSFPTIGAICHEYGHFLGAPDYYDRVNDYPNNFSGTGLWDVMGDGANFSFGICPPHHNPYTKCYIYNWCIPTVLTSTSADYTLYPSSQYNSFYQINTSTNGEFFLLENKASTAFNDGVPTEGGNLLIYHIHSDITDAIQSNEVNTSHPQRCYIVSSNATTNPYDSPTSYCPSSDIKSYPGTFPQNAYFTSTSIPSATAWNGASTGVNLCFIKRVGNNIQFTVNPPIVGQYMVSDQATYELQASLPSTATVEWSFTTSNISPNVYTGYQPISFVNGNTGQSVVIRRNFAYVLQDTQVGVVKVYYTGYVTLKATITDGGQTYSVKKNIQLGGPDPIRSASRETLNLSSASLDNSYTLKAVNIFGTHTLNVQLTQQIDGEEVPYNGVYTIELWSLSQQSAGNLQQIAQGDTSIDVSGISTGYYQLVAYIDGQIVSSQKILIK